MATSSSASTAAAAGRDAARRPLASEGDALRVGLLGINAWVVSVLLPVLHVGARSSLDVLTAVAPLLPLAAGVALSATGGRRGLERAALVLVFPVALAGALAARGDLAARGALDALGMLASALSVLAYGAVAARAVGRPEQVRETRVEALPLAARIDEPAGRKWVRRAVLGATAASAMLVTVVAPALGDREALVESWGEAADEATVLAAVLGGSASALAIAAIVGPALRAPRRDERAHRATRATVAVLIGSAALVGWLLLRWLDALAT